MARVVTIGGLEIEIELKAIKNTHLSVYPPDGRVLIAAPRDASAESLRLFVIKQLPWIRRQRARLIAQEREPPREYIERESHMLWGRRYLLQVLHGTPSSVALAGRTIKLQAPRSSSLGDRERIMREWYRAQLRARAAPLVAKWAGHLGVNVERVFLQQMKTKWGSSNPVRRSIRLNLELAKFTPDCLDYIVLHEVAHFRAPNHGKRFVDLLDRHMSGWRAIRDKLNRHPLAQWAATIDDREAA